MKKRILITVTSLIALTLQAQEKNAMYGGLEYSEFDGYNGFGYSISFEKNILSYLAVEVSLSNFNGSNFPENFNSEEYDANTFNWFDKTKMIDLSVRPHITFINTRRNFLSFFVGIGIMRLESDIFFSDQYVYEKFHRISRSLGFQYKYITNSNYFIGLKITQLQSLTQIQSAAVDYSTSGAIILGKRF